MRETALKTSLKAELERALALVPDALATLQRETGHELIRTHLLHPLLRFLDTAGRPDNRMVPTTVPWASVFALGRGGNSDELWSLFGQGLAPEHANSATAQHRSVVMTR